MAGEEEKTEGVDGRSPAFSLKYRVDQKLLSFTGCLLLRPCEACKCLTELRGIANCGVTKVNNFGMSCSNSAVMDAFSEWILEGETIAVDISEKKGPTGNENFEFGQPNHTNVGLTHPQH